MRRLIASLAEKITTTLGKRLSGNGVIGLATPWLPASRFARTLLTWLTGATPVSAQPVYVHRVRRPVVIGGADRLSGHHCPDMLRLRRRRMEPGAGASLKRS